jgi:signal transduction histidine kinase
MSEKPRFSWPYLLIPLGGLLGLGLLLFALVPQLELPSDLKMLLLFVTSTGLVTIGAAYTAYRFKLVRWFRSLRWALLIAILLMVVLLFVNVWVTAQLMFISEYDLQVTAALLVFVGLIAIIFGLIVSSAITDGIRELARAAEEIAKGDLTTRLSITGNDELAEFARRFNWMVAQLQEMDDQKRMLEQTRRDLIAWASHDLRTPLTALRAMNEAMTDGLVSDPETMGRYLRNMQGEIQHLSYLIDNLFELAQLDAGHLQLNFQEVSLRDLVSDTLEQMRLRAERAHIALSGAVANEVDMVCIAPEKIQRVLNNLLDNAIRYTPAGGRVRLHAVDAGENVCVSVNNFAPDLKPLEVDQVFTRFYRQERARAQSSDGYRGAGLGLAITRGFVEAHGGKIWVESTPEVGVTFTFTLPKARVSQ